MGDLDVTYAALQGMTVALDGSITYDFEGHIKADGLDLDASTIATPPSDERIRWLRKTDGAVVADLYAFEQSGVASASLNGYAPAPDTSVFAFLNAQAASGQEAVLRVHMAHTGIGSVAAFANASDDVTIIDNNNLSSFLKLLTDADIRAELDTATFLAVPAGGPTLRTAPVPWGNNHFGSALLSVIPSGAYGMSVTTRNNGIGAAGAGFAFANNPGLQDITVVWITLGN